MERDASIRESDLRIALISTDYPPLRTSAAVQLRDLAQEMLALGHTPVLLVPAEGQPTSCVVEMLDGVQVVRLSAFRFRDIGYVRRTLSELVLPFVMLARLRRSEFADVRWDAVVWYSPPIFFGPLVWFLKRASTCRAYLILRDIFPEWAVDLGLLRKGPAYYFFRLVARIQYAIADCIGVQSPSNLKYMESWATEKRRLEVLQNWLADAQNTGSSIVVDEMPIAGRKIFVYVGNMGIAQAMDVFIDLAEQMLPRKEIGFLFVGRGTESARLAAEARRRGLENVVFHGEIDSREIPGLLAQCHVGLLALDPRHRTHNIPGKFLTYLQAGLPVLARVNPGTDLVSLIETENVGVAYSGDSVERLKELAEALISDEGVIHTMAENGRALGRRMFSPTAAVEQITSSLKSA